ncbi:hypothetical protein BV898_08240 [Hypsibius exemplaris]|uniref:Dynein regulatory complex subunit 4 n=1 Tax=Hypsibius exemplaris TaxID=2072580 RepID=A0A1W0WQX9_HYPEX|nr:hypothetical protein BV898_08240 [Hypsibius exemplaris]
MPSKDPKNKKKKAKKEIIVDEKVNISIMTQEQLVRRAVLEAKLLFEAKKQRSIQEQERDMMFRKLEIVRAEMVEKEAEILSQAQDMEASQYLQHAELKVGRQRAKHLRYELDQALERAKTDVDTFVEEMRHGHVDIMTKLGHEWEELETKNVEERLACEQNTKECMMQAQKKHKAATDNYRNALVDRTEDLRIEKDEIEEDSALDVRDHICLLNQKRMEQIDKLQRNFEKNYHEIKQYFQELTYHNLTLINDLADQSSKLKRNLADLYSRYKGIQRQTEVSREPFKKQTARLAALKHDSDMFDKEKMSFARLQRGFAKMKKGREDLLQEIANHDENNAKIKKEYAFLSENFGPAMSEAKAIIGCEASVIRKKAAELHEQLETMKETLREAAVQSPDSRMEECLRELELIERQCLNNIALKKDMQITLDKMSKLYNDTLITMRYIVEEYGLPVDEFDLLPLPAGTAFRPAELGRICATQDALTPNDP